MKFLFAFTLLWVTAGAEPLGIEGRIYNGVDALPRQFPYMVYIERIIGNNFRACGGALISSRWVLTAAHCVDSPDYPSIIQIYLGSTYRQDAEVGYVVGATIAVRIHPFWNRITKDNDIALIEIPNTVPCSGIKPVPLPPLPLTTPPSYVGESGIATGWGKTNDSSGSSPRLQWGRMRVAPSALCGAFNPRMEATEMCIDTLTDSVSTCDGDSGGPFILESTGELVGIISYSFSRSCEQGLPVVFTRVNPYLHWIQSVTGISY